VTVTTGAPVYIHGGLFGSPYEACTQITTFLLCNDEFHVTPAPCSGSLQNLDIEVCWQETGSGPETLRFHCCTATYLLGNCECDCVTTLLYEGNGCTSDADIQMRGDAAIDSSGSGPLVLTEPITHSGSCERKLTLTGTNAGDNELSGVIEDGAGTTVEKTGTGLWRLSAANNYTDGLKVVEGTLVIPVNIDSGTTGSPFGRTVRPQIGGPSAASLLLVGGRSIGRSFDVVAGEGLVTIGGIGSGTASFNSTASIRLGRSVTLQAATGSAVVFAGDWRDAAGGSEPAVAFTLGSAGNIGLVVLQSILPETITSVNVFAGATARLNAGSETIARETPVVVGGGATLDLNGTDQPLESLTMSGNGIVITGGTLRLLDNAVASGSGGEIFSDVSLDGSATIDVAGNLVISGDVSGTSGFAKSGGGTLTLAGEISYTGATSITAGTLVVEKEFAGSADITKSTFTNGTLVVEFAAIPSPSATYQLLGGSTVQTYGPGAVTLTGAGGATGTYNSATSTLTVD
jgi:fibronectin-binding autotransporter adhesin